MNCRPVIFAIALLSCALATFAQAQSNASRSFPISAIVLNDGATTRCGPGDGASFYATHALKQGDVVEVWRFDPGGWSAIRPPQHSFSLVPQSAVKLVRDDVGEIVSPVPAFVGTKLGPVEKPQWQIRLKKGERVAIIGEVSWPNPSGTSNVWYQIEPPQGEFRWIRTSELQLPPDGQIAPPRSVASTPAASFPKNSMASNASGFKPTHRKPEPEPEPNKGWKKASRPIPSPVAKAKGRFVSNDTAASNPIARRSQAIPVPEDVFVDPDQIDIPKRDFPESAERDYASQDYGSQPPRQHRPTPERFASLNSSSTRSDNQRIRSYVDERGSDSQRKSPIQQTTFTSDRPDSSVGSEIVRIETALSAEMLKEPATWNLAPIQKATEKLMDASSDPVERLAIQRIMTKLDRCREVCAGYRQAGSSSRLTQNDAATPSQRTSNNNTYSTYKHDATGWLKRLVNSGTTGSLNSTYVLQDSTGKVTHHIAGSAGLNLNRYVDQKVGVIGGRRGYHQRLNLQHITADRIVVLR